MTIKKALQRSYYLMALLPILFFIFTAITINVFVNDHIITKEERIRSLPTILPIILSALILLILLIMTVNLIITRNQIKRITHPLTLLEKNTKMLIEGDLSTPISYSESDEFQQVFQAFDALRKQLSTSISERTQLENNRSAFLSGITHDILTPLTIIKGYVEALQDNIAQTPAQQDKYLSIINEKTRLIEQLVEKMTIINQFQSHHYPFNFKTYSAHNMLNQIYQTITRDYPNFSFSYENTIPLTVLTCVDYDEIHRVLINFIENSIKYVDNQSLSMMISTTHNDLTYTIIFRDNGQGIPKSQLPYIFDSFFRGDTARSNTKNGSGLGLAICQKIIQAHDGNLSASNDNGLQLKIELPVQQEEKSCTS